MSVYLLFILPPLLEAILAWDIFPCVSLGQYRFRLTLFKRKANISLDNPKFEVYTAFS